MKSIQSRGTELTWSRLVLVCLLTVGAVLIHGYHPFVEDAEIYVPGIKKLLNPELYPSNQGFFASHASMTFYPNLIAWSARIAHLPLEWVLFIWFSASMFVLLAGCWKLGNLCFHSSRAAWGGSIMVATLLTIPVGGTALYIMDQYMNPRSFSTATTVWIVASALEQKYVRAALWVVLTAFVHPLMAVFSLGFAVLLPIVNRFQRSVNRRELALPAMLFPPVTPTYLRALDSRSYFFILRWQWFEWMGIFGPIAIFWGLKSWAQQRKLKALQQLCLASIVFTFLCLAAALVITIPAPLVRFAELQPMRGLLLVYVFLFVVGGGLLAEYVLKSKPWRWLLLFLPIAAGMFYAQRQLFPATHHLEFPGRGSANKWVETFVWIRENTPTDAYFALNPDHMRMPGEDQHGFRAIAERSMLADNIKDSGAVTMFPALAETWQEQVDAQRGWKDFSRQDFEKLRDRFGVNWFVLEKMQTAGMECPHEVSELYVCRLPQSGKPGDQ